MKSIPALLLLGLVLLADPLRATTSTDPSEVAAIRAMLDAQVAGWNRGDVAAYMDYYVKSDQLRFASDGSITLGWQPTMERYLRRYSDKAAMGTLTCTYHEIEILGSDTALVFGKWELQRAADHPWGLFTLVVKKTPAGWRIASDHTSSAK